MTDIPETIIPNRAALPQEAYLSELALPLTVISESETDGDEKKSPKRRTNGGQ